MKNTKDVCGLYMIKNKINNKIYIGQTLNKINGNGYRGP
jgi:predicted GIY-YIG superfamily endonuclease